jgi:hypothetical protein
MADQPVTGGTPPGYDEPHAADLAGDLVDSLREWVKELSTAFDDALAGTYDAKRLVEDASRMTSRAIRDTAKVIVTGFGLATAVANRPPPGTPGPPGATLPAAPPH